MSSVPYSGTKQSVIFLHMQNKKCTAKPGNCPWPDSIKVIRGVSMSEEHKQNNIHGFWAMCDLYSKLCVSMLIHTDVTKDKLIWITSVKCDLSDT